MGMVIKEGVVNPSKRIATDLDSKVYTAQVFVVLDFNLTLVFRRSPSYRVFSYFEEKSSNTALAFVANMKFSITIGCHKG